MLGVGPRQIALSYRCIGQLIESGQPLMDGLEGLRVSLGGADRDVLTRLINRVQKGGDLAGAMNAEKLPPLDVALIRVGERTGTLTKTLGQLGQFYQERYEIERSMRRSLLKPGGLFLASLFLRDLPAVIGGDMSAARYVYRAFGLLGIVVFIVYFAFQVYRASYRSQHVANVWSRVLLSIPGLRRIAKTVALERFFTCLNIGLVSGVDLNSMIELGASMSALPRLKQLAPRIIQRLQKVGLAKAFEEAGVFRSEQLLVLRTGETAGQLEEATNKICQDLREETRFYVKTIEEWLPRIVYGLAMLYAISGIISTMTGAMRIQSEQFKAIDN